MLEALSGMVLELLSKLKISPRTKKNNSSDYMVFVWTLDADKTSLT